MDPVSPYHLPVSANPSVWWLPILPWAFACVAMAVLAWPLALRLFRGLADGGAGLASGVGIFATTYIAWLLAHPYVGDDRKALVLRLLLLAGAAGWVAGVSLFRPRDAKNPRWLFPAALMALCGIALVPHSSASVWIAALLVGACSVLAWWGEGARLRSALERTAMPFLSAQALFLAALVFFAGVRSYLPWATFLLNLRQAEKMGNLTHLNSLMRTAIMPPGDSWYSGEPINYYYGGHLMVATLAKASLQPAEIAFNLGLATVFALTVALGFSFIYNVVHTVARRTPWRRGFAWHHGLAWGLFGALAIACFGNLDAWQQLGTRNVDSGDVYDAPGYSPRRALQERQADALKVPSAAAGELIPRAMEAARPLIDAGADPAAIRAALESHYREFPADLAVPKPQQPGIIETRWSWENLTLIDFWRSSRAIKGTPPGVKEAGTITEFPYFSAILGDLHPHHMALPYTLMALSACLALIRVTARGARVRTDAGWFARGWIALLVMGGCIGAVFAVNIWDAVVLAFLYALVVALARKDVAAHESWRYVGYAGTVAVLFGVASLLLNARPDPPVLFGSRPHTALALFAMVAVPPLARFFLPRAFPGAGWLGGAVLGFVLAGLGGSRVQSVLTSGSTVPWDGVPLFLRDGLGMLALAGIAGLWTLRRPAPRPLWWYSAGAAYAIPGILALVVSFPIRSHFHSPLETKGRILASVLPPRLDPALASAGDRFWPEFWARSPVNPFPAELRTDLRDYFTHWGIFLLPVLALAVARLFSYRRMAGAGPGFALLMVALMLKAAAFNAMGKWTGPLALSMTAVSLWFAFAFRQRREAAAWIFLACAFFWSWWVEVLHFDDRYGGNLERYNTPFKIYYPLWPMFAAGLAVALRELFVRTPPVAAGRPLSVILSSRFATLAGAVALAGILLVRVVGPRAEIIPAAAMMAVVAAAALVLYPPTRRAAAEAWQRFYANVPAFLAALVCIALGMLYPVAATVTRTRDAHARNYDRLARELATTAENIAAGNPQAKLFPYADEFRWDFHTVRTLNAIAWLEQSRAFAGDLGAIEWLRANADRGTVIVEATGSGAYTPEGRVAAMTGLPSIIGWQHHEMQWRGWDKPASPRLQRRFAQWLLPGFPLANPENRPEAAGGLPDLNNVLRASHPGLELLPMTQVALLDTALVNPERLASEVAKALDTLSPEEAARIAAAIQAVAADPKVMELDRTLREAIAAAMPGTAGAPPALAENVLTPLRQAALYRAAVTSREATEEALLALWPGTPRAALSGAIDILQRRAQRRLWSSAITYLLVDHVQRIYEAPEFDSQTRALMEFHGVGYIVMGRVELARFGKGAKTAPATWEGRAKFDRLDAPYSADVPVSMRPEDGTYPIRVFRYDPAKAAPANISARSGP